MAKSSTTPTGGVFDLWVFGEGVGYGEGVVGKRYPGCVGWGMESISDSMASIG